MIIFSHDNYIAMSLVAQVMACVVGADKSKKQSLI
jgi:hypothetical protein